MIDNNGVTSVTTLDSDRLAHILVCAFRYSLGRQTYITGICSDWLIDYWGILSPHSQEQIHSDIQQALAGGSAGMNCDRAAWAKILALPVKTLA